MLQLWNDIVAILKAPFVGNLDLIQLFLVVGAILIIAAAWVFILNHVRMAAEEI